MSLRRVGAQTRIVVVDDDAVLADLVCELLSDEGFAVTVQHKWEVAHEVVARQQPDLVLLDLWLGDAEHGWRVLDHLTLNPATRSIPVILWSGAVETLRTHARALLRARTYVLAKPFDLDKLLSSIYQALADGRSAPPLDVRRTLAALVQAAPSLLTRREQEVAILIARGCSNRQIGDELVITSGTVANHVAHILEKLECSSRIHVAMWAVAQGLVGATGQPHNEAGLPRFSHARAIDATTTRADEAM